ncbi:hypothetical protein D3C83_21940 [compost metagenome]
MTVDRGAFKECSFFQHALEFGRGDEMIVAAVDLAVPRHARGVRNRQLHGRFGLDERGNETRLAGPGGRAHDEEDPAHDVKRDM